MPTDPTPGAPRATEGRAVDACAAYQHWASEVRRLTVAIGAIQCPKESVIPDDWSAGTPLPLLDEDGRSSCFGRAASEIIPGWQDDDGTRRRTLDEIAAIVLNCRPCSELVGLIRARRYARKRFGVAKRAVRFAGKRALTTGVQP